MFGRDVCKQTPYISPKEEQALKKKVAEIIAETRRINIQTDRIAEANMSDLKESKSDVQRTCASERMQ